jgi:nucleoside-diphosphate-sugar epimerase
VGELSVGVIGASSLVGRCALPLLRAVGWQVVAFSRQPVVGSDGINWRLLSPVPRIPLPQEYGRVSYWLCVAPIWVLPDYFSLIEASGAQRVVSLSSTSRFTKMGSSDTAEKAIAAKLIESEARLQAWAESRNIDWVVLRPTLIYGKGKDKNISEIAGFIRRFGFFPLLGSAQGLRQPIHAEDVAAACVGALRVPKAGNRAYDLSGGETLPYREMVVRAFAVLGRRTRLVTVPFWAFRLAVAMLCTLPRYRHWSVAMAERMNQDLVFDHADAARDLGFKPRGFTLLADDIPQ